MPLYNKIQKWQTRLAVIKPNADQEARLELNLVVANLVNLDDGVLLDGERLDDNVEKAFQIPRMKRIYSKASTVFVWLGDARGLRNIIQRCNEHCGLSQAEPLACPRHSKRRAWDQILECSWFLRTWVRQEVYAARKLEVCFPDFSTPWETFVGHSSNIIDDPNTRNDEAVRNLKSLNETYNIFRKHRVNHPIKQLLDLLQEGSGFQASVPHDHIYSILGMIMTPDNGKELIPIDYNKSYAEVCGDVTRALIRETRDVRTLELCALQDNKIHALDWPHLRWPPSDPHILEEALSQSDCAPVYWFETKSPIRSNAVEAAIQPIEAMPLVLYYGMVWETLRQVKHGRAEFLVEKTREDGVVIREDLGTDNSFPLLFKHGLLRTKSGGK
ncbi:het-6-heterokaryon incompatibility [Apiospora saccharicola]|uniref:Het-6-heterokaryon incompatibility n=1 Tax=Apiospora saccharicola TaxID=335842 RepID=A0ABR1VB02_9PEZI